MFSKNLVENSSPNGPSAAVKLWRLFTRAQRRNAALLLSLMLVGMVLEALGVSLVVPAIAVLTQPDYSERFPALKPVLEVLGHPSHHQLVVGAMLVLAGAYFFKAIFLAFLIWRQARFAFGVQAQLSERLFTAYLRQPYTFHLRRNSAQLLRNVTVEVDLFTENALKPGLLLLTESLVLLGLCTLLLVIEPVGTLILASVLILAAVGFYRLTRGRIAYWGLARQHHEGMRIQHLQQGLGGVKDVKLLGRENEFLAQYRIHNAKTVKAKQLQSILLQLPRLWLEVLAVCGLVTLVIVLLAQGRALSTVLPTLGMFAAAAFRLMPSVNRMLGAVQSVRYGLPIIDALYKELNILVPAEANEPVAEPFRKALELKNVSFTYPGSAKPALIDLSLTINRGESIGLIGSSGAGKSTLVDILLGLLDPDVGEVRVDGKDIRANLRNWQNQIGYVSQSIYLTDDTLKRNVAFGLPIDQIDDTAVQRAINAAQMEQFVANLPEGIQTVVGERGIRLSGGQRQRIGIARALYQDPPILVLDEATSSLDLVTERDVMDAVHILHGQKTVLIVAHRLSTVENCDRVFKLEHGRIIDQGPAMELLTSSSRCR